MLTKIEIDGVDVSSYCVRWQYERTFGDLLSEINLTFIKTISTIVTIKEGLILNVYRGWSSPIEENIFRGYIEKFEPEAGTIVVTGIDKLWDLVRKEVNKVYDSSIDPSAGKISEIFKDLVTNYGGLNTSSTNVQDSGSTILLTRFVCIRTDIFERCKKLADILDWQFYYDSVIDEVFFEPKGFEVNPTSLTIGGNVMQIPRWQYDITEMVNDLTVVGAYQEVETTENGRIGTTAGYTTASISISYEPISVKVYGDANNPPTTLKTGGMPESSTAFDYYVDKSSKLIYPKDGTTFTTDDYYEIRYSLAAPIPVNMYNQDSMDTYGRFSKTITYTDIRNVFDAEQRGINYLSRYSTPFIYTTLKVKNAEALNLYPGQQIRVIDNISSPVVDKWLVINKLRNRWPADYDELDVGDKYWRLADFQSTVMEKLKRVEEDEFANQQLVNDLINVNNAAFNPVKAKNRYCKVMYETVSGVNVFILGHPTFGVIGTQELGDAGIGADTNSWIGQFENKYEEDFYDADFEDIGSTTANWDISNHYIKFTPLQVAQSSSIDYNNGTITSAYMEVTYSGGLLLQLSADGGVHWENCTGSAVHSFAHTGTDLRFKFTENLGGNAQVTKVVVNQYH